MSQVVDFEVETPTEHVAPAPAAPLRRGGFWPGLAVGFCIATALALLVGLAVGLTTGGSTSTALTEDVTTLPLTPELVSRNWTEVVRRARGSAIRWWFWGLDETINAFVERTYGVPLLQEFGIRLEAVHLNDTFEAVDQVRAEVAAGNDRQGTVDLIWINGENFAAMKAEGLLFGPFAERLPLAGTVNWANSALAYDFGVPVEGLESVWSQAQYQFVYLPARTPEAELPRSFAAWLAYARAHPGRLTYIFPNPGDFLAARFIKQALLELAPRGFWEGPFSAAKYAQYAPQLWQQLAAVAPFLWRNGTRYPDAFSDLDRLFLLGETDFAATHDAAGAQTNIDDGHYPPGSKAFIWHTVSIGDYNYVAIPRNAANAPAALVLANLILRPDRQALQKVPSEGFGLGFGVDYNALPEAQRVVLRLADGLLGGAAVPAGELAQYLVGDLGPEYHTALVRDWAAAVGGSAIPWKASEE